MSSPDGSLGVTEAARELGVSDKTVRRWIRSGKLPATVVRGPYGPAYRVPAEAVRGAQQVVDVVKVERPTDPMALALAVARAIEQRDAGIRDELTALRQQIHTLSEALRQTEEARKEHVRAQEEARAAIEDDRRRLLMEDIRSIMEEYRRPEGRRSWWRFWKRR